MSLLDFLLCLDWMTPAISELERGEMTQFRIAEDDGWIMAMLPHKNTQYRDGFYTIAVDDDDVEAAKRTLKNYNIQFWTGK